ncbi:unnamed protein product [Caenorhabditis sp. 36 PRJEB53466]|nr:unnamed protein product [Caenorhabditis sp. 36 PRJEB53466]
MSDELMMKLARNLHNSERVRSSLVRLLSLDVAHAQFRRFGVRRLAKKYVDDRELGRVAHDLLDKIRRLQEEEEKENRREKQRKRRLSTENEEGKCKKWRCELDVPSLSPESKREEKKGKVDVSKLQNVPESEYDAVRPILVTLSAKELKAFMDRNPQIEKIADGLFRRHCQVDCPEEVDRKEVGEKWRTLHDVHTNWKMYEETKHWQQHLEDDLARQQMKFKSTLEYLQSSDTQ